MLTKLELLSSTQRAQSGIIDVFQKQYEAKADKSCKGMKEELAFWSKA